MAIARVYQQIIEEWPRIISESVMYEDGVKCMTESYCSLPFLEAELIKDPNRVSLLDDWYSVATSKRIHDDRILSMFMHILSGSNNLIPEWHIKVCRHYGPDLTLRMPDYHPPLHLMRLNGKVLSAFINCISEESFRMKSLFPLNYIHSAITTIALGRYLCESSGVDAAVSFMSSHHSWHLSWNDLVLIKMFTLQLIREGGIYTHWLLPYPFQYTLDPTRYPVIESQEVVDLLHKAPLDADPSLVKWLMACRRTM